MCLKATVNTIVFRNHGLNFIFELRVVACATGRLHAGMTLDYSGNGSHDASLNCLWGLGEATGVMLVFFIPGTTKVLFGDRQILGTVFTLRPLARSGGSGRGGCGFRPADRRPGQTTIGEAEKKPRRPERGPAMMDSQNDDEDCQSSTEASKERIIMTSTV
jgi:hypothetical protein